MAAEKSPTRISQRLFATSRSETRIIMDNCNIIEKLQGKKLGVIDRASSMLCLEFGSKYIDDTYKGIHNLEVYEFQIHVQCAWRIVNNRLGNIIVASEDIYEPKENGIVPESFDWEQKGNNMFDYKAKNGLNQQKIFMLIGYTLISLKIYLLIFLIILLFKHF